MENIYKNGRCRSCNGPLEIADTKNSKQMVRCKHCGDTYWREITEPAEKKSVLDSIQFNDEKNP